MRIQIDIDSSDLDKLLPIIDKLRGKPGYETIVAGYDLAAKKYGFELLLNAYKSDVQHKPINKKRRRNPLKSV